jgi:parallel beta-helix repeat protein
MKEAFACLALFAALLSFPKSNFGEDMKATFYVATNGNDDWSGRLSAPNATNTDGPFATLDRARDAVRELKKKQAPKEAITVMVRGGKYYLDQTLVLDPEDSGSDEFPITYRAYGEEQPILSGGRKIAGWKPYKGKIFQADVAGTKGGQWRFRQLFFDGQRQVRARYPNFDASNPLYGGWAVPEGEGRPDAFNYEPGTFPRHWAKPREGEVFLLSIWGLTDTVPIKSVDEKERLITLVDRVQDWSGMPYMFFEPPFHLTIGRSDRFPGGGFHFYVENLLEELDQPGEWCLDSEEGVVYFWPPTGSVGGSDVVAPALSTLVDLSGASYVTISGFTFTETTTGDVMHRGGQEGYGAMLPMPGRKYVGEALHMQGAAHCRIENNLFYAVGGNGIYLEGYNSRNVIQGNEISYAGAIGICLIGSHYENPKVPKRYPIYNEVLDNYIHHCGVFNKYVAGIFLGLSQANVVGHNRIEYMPHHGINLGNSGYGRNVVEYNELRHTGLQTCDKGAINSWMEDPDGRVEREAVRSGHVIRYNLIADFESRCVLGGSTHAGTENGWAVYLDNWTSNSFVYGNIIVRSGLYGVVVNGGQNNFIENNVIVDASSSATRLTPGDSAGVPQMEGYMMGNRFSRNIFYSTKTSAKSLHRHSAALDEPITDALAESDYNLFFNTTTKEFVVGETRYRKAAGASGGEFNTKEISLAEWQKMGFDTHSVVADPLFVDPQHDDYRLKPESPALKLGFQQIDASQIGPRKRFKSHLIRTEK